MQPIHTIFSRLIHSWGFSFPDNPSQSAKVCYEFFKERAEIYFDPRSALERACKSGNVAQARALLGQLHLGGPAMSHMLFLAIEAMQPDIVALLLEWNANPHPIHEKWGTTMDAVLSKLTQEQGSSSKEKLKEIALLLIEHDVVLPLTQEVSALDIPDVIEAFIQRDPLKAFVLASYHNNAPLADSIWDRIEPTQTNLDPLLVLAVIYEQQKLIKLLLEKGADPRYQDPNGETSITLHFCTSSYSPEEFEEIALLLIDKGAELSFEELGMAFEKNLPSVIQAFIQKNPQHPLVTAATHSTFSVAYQNRDMAQLILLMHMRNINEKDQNTGKTLLHIFLESFLANNHCYSQLEELLKRGADLHLADNQGKTPMDLIKDILRNQNSPDPDLLNFFFQKLNYGEIIPFYNNDKINN